MGNCKKQNSKRPELNINELFKRIKFESKQIQNTFREIEGLLKKSKEVMQQLLTAKNNGLLNGNTFFNVAEAPAAPVTPAVPIPIPTPAAPAPVTPLVQIVIKDIARIARQITIKQAELRESISLALITAVTLRQTDLSEDEEAVIFARFFSQIGNIARVNSELQALRDELDADIVILLGIAGEL
ncbi:hypothetical protein [Priestia megaterium]|uniref:hypothetical protein n=1 Tax=Priestia megaterium TaxID=1404 RepID=UPI0023DC793B|nr:hypothetical protein [Priestia megaterium]MDF2010160.1 hypothetical protein [Priestia megaterium]